MIAGGFIGETLGVYGCGDGAAAGLGICNGLCNLVHASYHNDAFRAKDQGCHPVPIAINIVKLSVLADGIAAHKISVAEKSLAHQLPSLLRGGGAGYKLKASAPCNCGSEML